MPKKIGMANDTEKPLLFVSYDEKPREIASRFVAIRKREKISRQRLSAISGVSYSSIRRLESLGEISLSSLVKLALALRLYEDIDNLFKHETKYQSIEDLIRDQKN